MSNQLLVEGEIVFSDPGSSFSNATVYIRLEDTSRMDAASRVVAEQIIQNVSHQNGNTETLLFILYGQAPDVSTTYTVSVHIDVDRDEQISSGDYINMQSYPVLTFGRLNRLSVAVCRVQ